MESKHPLSVLTEHTPLLIKIGVAGNKTRAAALLSLSRLGLRKKIERYGIQFEE